jgi:hypothetical protein
MNQGIYGVSTKHIASMPYGINGIVAPTLVKVLVVGGGGGGGNGQANSRSGAGGGGGGVIETQLFNIILNQEYIVRIGAGGAAQAIGNFSRFSDIMATGGGGSAGTTYFNMATGAGSISTRQASIFTHQGFSGGTGLSNSGGGGGGAGGQGVDATSTDAGNGGIGFLNNTTAISTYYGGGGGGGGKNFVGNTSNPGIGGLGGGGNGGTTSPLNGSAGAINTGGGGGGGSGHTSNTSGGSGGSGIIVLRFDSLLQTIISVGLTATTTTFGSEKIITITAGTGTIIWS